MTKGIQRFLRKMVLTAAASGIFNSDPTCLHAEVLKKAGTGITIDLGEAKRLAPEEVRDRGMRLRAALDKAYNGLQDTGKAGHANEFSAIILPYISAGMALEDADGILSAAGFIAPPRPSTREEHDRSQRMGWCAVVAEIPQFAGRVFGPVDVFVMLLPPEQRLAEYAGRRHRMMYYPRPRPRAQALPRA